MFHGSRDSKDIGLTTAVRNKIWALNRVKQGGFQALDTGIRPDEGTQTQ